MLVKRPKSTGFKSVLRKGVIGFIVVETVLFGAAYAAWYGVNTKREYRKYLHDHFPAALNLYYTLGEKFDSDLKRIRELDNAYWDSEGH